MSVKASGQPSFAEALVSTKGGGGALDRLQELVKWYRFEKLIGHLRDLVSPGRPGYGLVRAVITTPANVNDTTPADRLIRGDEAVVWADAAYHTHARAAALAARGVKARLMRRPNKHHRELPPRLKRYNCLIARRRAAVETTFATWKQRMRLSRIPYVGLAKAHAQVVMVAIAFNLRRWVRLAPA